MRRLLAANQGGIDARWRLGIQIVRSQIASPLQTSGIPRRPGDGALACPEETLFSQPGEGRGGGNLGRVIASARDVKTRKETRAVPRIRKRVPACLTHARNSSPAEMPSCSGVNELARQEISPPCDRTSRNAGLQDPRVLREPAVDTGFRTTRNDDDATRNPNAREENVAKIT